MTCSYLDHPSEEALERFLLHHAQEDELDRVETHILACDACVARLEELEIQVAAAKLALQELSREAKPEKTRERNFRKEWFNFRSLSFAGAAAAIALTVAVAPHFVSRAVPAADVTLTANRGPDTTAVPQGRPLHLHLSAQDVANGPVHVVIVNAEGSAVWNGTAQAQNDRVEVAVPKVDESGTHFLRLYSVRTDGSAGDLLREFPFEVK